MSNEKGPIIIAILTLIGVIVGAYLTYRAGEDAILIPLRATQTAEAKLTLIAPPSTPALSLSYVAPRTPDKPNNLVERFDFENSLPPNTSMGVCDNTPLWYQVCHEAPGRFKLASGGFTGEKSLEVQIEILPEKEQVYTLRLPVSPPEFVDAVNAKVFISKANRFAKITLAAHVKDKNVWIFSDMKPDRDGWLHLLVDLQGYKYDASISSGEIAIDEIHVDMFIVKGGLGWGDEQVLIDDVELYYPLPKPMNTGP
jgi:hypothetical protein